MLNLRKEKVLKLDFQKFCAGAEREKPKNQAVKAFKHKAYNSKGE